MNVFFNIFHAGNRPDGNAQLTALTQHFFEVSRAHPFGDDLVDHFAVFILDSRFVVVVARIFVHVRAANHFH